MTVFPILYLTLELPKRIINDAIAARSSVITLAGIDISQISFLALLCLAFLGAVSMHGFLKMRINTMKGVLAERMLRRFRYSLISRILRFPKPYFQHTSQGELVSMVTSEAEPLGGIMGDAIAHPVLQAGQMLTILSFLFLQSVWFGLAAVSLIPLQAWLIPKLQKQINLLNKKRILEVRNLASEIGESAAGASTLRINGGSRYRLALISDRLGWLFDIRLQIYKKKFFMKFINNFITQLTPFFFFSMGGYLVIQGSITLGALVAALAAYKDLSSPWKELLTYYNQIQDMSLRWKVIIERFTPHGMIEETLFEGQPDHIPSFSGDITFNKVTVVDVDGNAILEDLQMTFPKGGTIAVASASEEDRRAFTELLTRETSPSSGAVQIAGQDLANVHQAVIAARIGYASSRPYVFDSTIGDTVMMPLKTKPTVAKTLDPGDSHWQDLLAEAQRTGNSLDRLEGEWLDPSLAGLKDDEAVRDWWLELIEGMGTDKEVYRRCLDQRVTESEYPELTFRLVGLRQELDEKIRSNGLDTLYCRFDLPTYNPTLSLATNLFLALPKQGISHTDVAGHSDFIQILRDTNLESDLLTLAQEVIEMFRQTFGVDGTSHPLFRKLSIDPDVYKNAIDFVQRSRDSGPKVLKKNELALVLSIPFLMTSEQAGPAFTPALQAKIENLRDTQYASLAKRLGDLFDPLDPTRYAPELTIMENALFGKIPTTVGTKAEILRELLSETLLQAGLKKLFAELLYNVPTGHAGANLSSAFTERLSFSRAAIKRPDILILDHALASYSPEIRLNVFRKLRIALPETTFFFLEDKFADPQVYDVYMELQHGRIQSDQLSPTEEDNLASADLSKKLKALEIAELFAELDRKQLRLLAFGARWFTAKAGEVIFSRGDDPSDGAYLILEGDAGLYFPLEGLEDELISTAHYGDLVGELALIRDNRRRLSLIAHTDINALRIGVDVFLAVLEADTDTALKLLRAISNYLSDSADQVIGTHRFDH